MKERKDMEHFNKKRLVWVVLPPLLIGALAVFLSLDFTRTIRPTEVEEFALTTVMVTSMEGKSGGSGVILDSFNSESHILTNAHVCGLLKKGGKIITNNQVYLATGYKISEAHDLCLVRIAYNLGIRTVLAKHKESLYSEVVIAGHPNLLPLIVTRGHMSERMNVRIITGSKPCTQENIKTMTDYLFCALFNMIPIIKTFETDVTSATILPGSSGSGVFNSSGELIGLAFASNSRELNYAMTVPYEYLVFFLKEESKLKDWKIPDENAQESDEEAQKRSFRPEILEIFR